jgi:hypothetical protein
MGNNLGWIKVHRSIIDTPEWLAEPFTRGQAWIDLLLLANHKTGHIRKRGILITVDRGQVGYSQDTLAYRWQWSKGKVRRFLVELERLSRITHKISEKTVLKKTSVSSLITIVNYDKYQMNDTEGGTENEPKTVPEQEYKECKNKYSDPFLIFYKAYPRKANKPAAYRAWKKHNGNLPSLEILCAAIERQKNSRQWQIENGQYIPYPSSWLNGEGWLNETGEVSSSW